MKSSIAVPVGVVIAREKINHPWQEYIWRPVGVLLNPPELSGWRELRRDARSVHYHAATLPLELHRKETAAYNVNLETGAPAIYIVTRNDPAASSEWPVKVHLVTASPHDAQAYNEAETDSIGQVPMPGPLVELLREFVAAHHKEEPFVKRKRQRYEVEEEHKFGQEPIFVLRERMRAKRRNGSDHD